MGCSGGCDGVLHNDGAFTDRDDGDVRWEHGQALLGRNGDQGSDEPADHAHVRAFWTVLSASREVSRVIVLKKYDL